MKLGRNILTLFLTALVFITSTGMTLNLHFCADDLQNISIDKHASNCNMPSAVSKKSSKDCDSKSSIKKEDTCCKDQQIKAKNPVKTDTSKVKDENSFIKSLVFLKTYIVNFFSFETTDDEDDKKPNLSLFPLLKEGLYILLGQFRN